MGHLHNSWQAWDVATMAADLYQAVVYVFRATGILFEAQLEYKQHYTPLHAYH